MKEPTLNQQLDSVMAKLIENIMQVKHGEVGFSVRLYNYQIVAIEHSVKQTVRETAKEVK